MSALDAVDGLLHRHGSAMDVGAVEAPTIRRSQACKRSRRSVSISLSRFFKSTELTRRVIWSFAVDSLVARARSAGAYGAPDAGGLREALRQAAEERCCRR